MIGVVMRISIHQPNYFPWVGYFHKISNSDTFVFLDTVEYSPGFCNRNKIKIKEGSMWLTVPVVRNHISHKKISGVEIDTSKKWRKKHWNAIQTNYSKSACFDDFKDFFKSFYSKEWQSLSEMNIFAIKEISKTLGFNTKFIKSSEIDVEGKSSSLLLNICKKLGADEYISGEGGKNYMDLEIFKNNHVNVIFQKFNYPKYKQMFVPPFIENLSIIDILLNEGVRTSDIIRGI